MFEFIQKKKNLKNPYGKKNGWCHNWSWGGVIPQNCVTKTDNFGGSYCIYILVFLTPFFSYVVFFFKYQIFWILFYLWIDFCVPYPLLNNQPQLITLTGYLVICFKST